MVPSFGALEANAALRAIVRRENGETYRQMLTRMAQESGVATPTIDDLVRLDRARKGKRLSNEEWAADRSGCEDRAHEGRDDASRLQARACGRPGYGRHRGGADPRGRRGRHDDAHRTLDEARRSLTSVGAPPSKMDPAECVADKILCRRSGP